MRYIRQFNEGTSAGWREVNTDEMNRLMSREFFDNFSPNEVGAITKVIADLGLVGVFHECEIPVRDKGLRLYMLTSVITLLKSTPISASKVGRTRGPFSFSTEIIKGPSNMVYFSNSRFLFSILKSDDDTFFVRCNKDSGDISLYVCDQLPGLLSAIKVILGK